MINPKLAQFDVTGAMKAQNRVLENLVHTLSALNVDAVILRPLVDATGELAIAWETYLRSLDPEGWDKAKAEDGLAKQLKV